MYLNELQQIQEFGDFHYMMEVNIDIVKNRAGLSRPYDGPAKDYLTKAGFISPAGFPTKRGVDLANLYQNLKMFKSGAVGSLSISH